MSSKNKRKVFGLVSKIGSLIKRSPRNNMNTDNIETSGRSPADNDAKKGFNIQISEDDQEIVDINDMEEEEEEEDDENNNNINNNSQKNTNTNNENILIFDNKKEETNINNSNLINNKSDIINKDKGEKNKIKEDINNNKNESTTNEEELNKDDDIYNDYQTCHVFLKKGYEFNLNDYKYIPIKRNKKIKGVFGLFKKQKTEAINYNIFFNENYIYFSKDIIFDKKEKSKRRISSCVSLYNIIDINNSRESNKIFCIEIEIQKSNGETKIKQFIIENKYLKEFYDTLHQKMQLLGINLSSKNF